MNSKLIIYPEFESRIERDYMYTVSVTDSERTVALPVYNHVEDNITSRNARDITPNEYRRFSSFSFEGEGVRVDIKVNCDFESYSVMPSAKGFKNEFHNGVISVWLDKPDYFVVRLDNKDSTNISILADHPESEIPAECENTYIIDGWHEVEGGIWEVDVPNTTIYIKAGSVLNARLHVTADGFKLLGRGALVDPFGDIYHYDVSKNKYGVTVYLDVASDVLIDGIHILDSKAFNIYAKGKWLDTYASGIRIRNVKIFSTQMSSDGIALNYFLRDCSAEHCFIYCSDNAIVNGGGTVYRDITIGTTCNAIYPQGDIRNYLVEDIYIFRADEGIINDQYQYLDDLNMIQNILIQNIHAEDVTDSRYVLYIEVPSHLPMTTFGDGMVIKNIYLPEYKNWCSPWFFYRSIAKTGNFGVKIKNAYMGGRLLRSIDSESVGGIVDPNINSFEYAADATEETAACILTNTVNYKCPSKVTIGNYQIYFRSPVFIEGEIMYLPYAELCERLNIKANASTVLKDGVEYIAHTALVGEKLAEEVRFDDGGLTIIPYIPEGNLLLPYNGIVSRYTEFVCFRQHLVAYKDSDNLIYKVIKTNKPLTETGIYRVVNDTLKSYGEGVYTLSFEARNSGQTQVNLNCGFMYGVDCTVRDTSKSFEISNAWNSFSMDFEVGQKHMQQENLSVAIFDNSDTAQEFEVKNISLTKKKANLSAD